MQGWFRSISAGKRPPSFTIFRIRGKSVRNGSQAGVAPRPIPKGHTRVYRAVSEAEYQQVLRTGKFEGLPGGAEGKWFADSAEGAMAHGRGLYPDGKFRLIEVDVPDNAPSLYQWANLDGHGPARYLSLEDLLNVLPRPLE